LPHEALARAESMVFVAFGGQIESHIHDSREQIQVCVSTRYYRLICLIFIGFITLNKGSSLLSRTRRIRRTLTGKGNASYITTASARGNLTKTHTPLAEVGK
jgi:hypothetical protein